MFGDFVDRRSAAAWDRTWNVEAKRSDATSGTVIFTVQGEDRRYLHCIGANADFSLADVDFSLLDDARVLYVGGYLAMPASLPTNWLASFRRPRSSGSTTVLDVVMPAGASVSASTR